MKKIILLNVMIVFILFSCKKENVEPIVNDPPQEVIYNHPDELIGKWQNGVEIYEFTDDYMYWIDGSRDEIIRWEYYWHVIDHTLYTYCLNEDYPSVTINDTSKIPIDELIRSFYYEMDGPDVFYRMGSDSVHYPYNKYIRIE
jgi:hypothetical protein